MKKIRNTISIIFALLFLLAVALPGCHGESGSESSAPFANASVPSGDGTLKPIQSTPTYDTSAATQDSTNITQGATTVTQGSDPSIQNSGPTQGPTQSTQNTVQPTDGSTYPTQGTTQPTHGDNPATEGTTVPTETTPGQDAETTEPSTQPENRILTYEEYIALTSEEQKAYYNSFEGDQFYAWFRKALKEFNEKESDIVIGEDGSLDLGNIDNGSN